MMLYYGISVGYTDCMRDKRALRAPGKEESRDKPKNRGNPLFFFKMSMHSTRTLHAASLVFEKNENL